MALVQGSIPKMPDRPIVQVPGGTPHCPIVVEAAASTPPYPKMPGQTGSFSTGQPSRDKIHQGTNIFENMDQYLGPRPNSYRPFSMKDQKKKKKEKEIN